MKNRLKCGVILAALLLASNAGAADDVEAEGGKVEMYMVTSDGKGVKVCNLAECMKVLPPQAVVVDVKEQAEAERLKDDVKRLNNIVKGKLANITVSGQTNEEIAQEIVASVRDELLSLKLIRGAMWKQQIAEKLMEVIPGDTTKMADILLWCGAIMAKVQS